MNIKSIINFQNKNLSYFVSMSFVSSFSRETIFLKKKKKKKKKKTATVQSETYHLSSLSRPVWARQARKILLWMSTVLVH